MESLGLLHLYYGDGKGKTTAAMGLGFVQHQHITGLRQRRRKVFVLQSAGSGLFGFVHLKDEFLPGLAPVDGGTQLFQQRDLPALPAL